MLGQHNPGSGQHQKGRPDARLGRSFAAHAIHPHTRGDNFSVKSIFIFTRWFTPTCPDRSSLVLDSGVAILGVEEWLDRLAKAA